MGRKEVDSGSLTREIICDYLKTMGMARSLKAFLEEMPSKNETASKDSVLHRLLIEIFATENQKEAPLSSLVEIIESLKQKKQRISSIQMDSSKTSDPSDIPPFRIHKQLKSKLKVVNLIKNWDESQAIQSSFLFTRNVLFHFNFSGILLHSKCEKHEEGVHSKPFKNSTRSLCF